MPAIARYRPLLPAIARYCQLSPVIARRYPQLIFPTDIVTNKNSRCGAPAMLEDESGAGGSVFTPGIKAPRPASSPPFAPLRCGPAVEWWRFVRVQL
jgi:hypothetical protein